MIRFFDIDSHFTSSVHTDNYNEPLFHSFVNVSLYSMKCCSIDCIAILH
jgi:hypothetical protein